jgi:hypothetical protein
MMDSVLDVAAKALNSRNRGGDGGSLARMCEIVQITEGSPQRADASVIQLPCGVAASRDAQDGRRHRRRRPISAPQFRPETASTEWAGALGMLDDQARCRREVSHARKATTVRRAAAAPVSWHRGRVRGEGSSGSAQIATRRGAAAHGPSPTSVPTACTCEASRCTQAPLARLWCSDVCGAHTIQAVQVFSLKASAALARLPTKAGDPRWA